MRLAICDDNPQDLQQICDLAAQHDKNAHIRAFSTARALYESGETFDAVILDIEMQSPNGFEVALRLARQEIHPIIIFATNSAAYALRGYGLALRYLLKPLTLEALSEALDAVKDTLHRNRFTLTVDGITHVLQVQQLRYAEVSGHRLTLHLDSGVLTCRVTLKDIAALLPTQQFCAPHQSYMVNLLHVRTVAKDAVWLYDGTRIPLSRRRQPEFLQAFHAFMGVEPW